MFFFDFSTLSRLLFFFFCIKLYILQQYILCYWSGLIQISAGLFRSLSGSPLPHHRRCCRHRGCTQDWDWPAVNGRLLCSISPLPSGCLMHRMPCSSPHLIIEQKFMFPERPGVRIIEEWELYDSKKIYSMYDQMIQKSNKYIWGNQALSRSRRYNAMKCVINFEVWSNLRSGSSDCQLYSVQRMH